MGQAIDMGGWYSELAGLSGVELATGVPLAPKTTLGIGGPAVVLAVAHSVEAVVALWRTADRWKVPLAVLGGGSNVLIADTGWPGIVLQLGRDFDFIRVASVDAPRVIWEAGAATSCAKMVRRATLEGLSGLERMSGIPGQLGGALVGNAGGRDGDIAEIVQTVHLVADGRPKWISGREIGFAYRFSAFPQGAIVLAAQLGLGVDDPAAVAGRVEAAQARRHQRQPWRGRSAGSTFKNPSGRSAGRLIEQAGCKGWQEGAARVSEQHANFIINEGQATAADVRRLIERVRDRVAEVSGTVLDLEMRLLGFSEDEEGR